MENCFSDADTVKVMSANFINVVMINQSRAEMKQFRKTQVSKQLSHQLKLHSIDMDNDHLHTCLKEFCVTQAI